MVEQNGVMTEVDNRSVKLYNREPSIELSDWSDAYQLSFENINFLKYKNNETQLFCCSGNSINYYFNKTHDKKIISQIKELYPR